jgi:anti-sigma-K factor RskA
MNLFADELVRAWRLTHNPEARIAEVEDTESPWRKAAVPIAVVAAFVLVLLALIFFPVDRLTQPAVAPVRPDLSQ